MDAFEVLRSKRVTRNQGRRGRPLEYDDINLTEFQRRQLAQRRFQAKKKQQKQQQIDFKIKQEELKNRKLSRQSTRTALLNITQQRDILNTIIPEDSFNSYKRFNITVSPDLINRTIEKSKQIHNEEIENVIAYYNQDNNYIPNTIL